MAQTSVTPTNEPLGTGVGAFVPLGMGVVAFVLLFVALLWRKRNLWIQALCTWRGCSPIPSQYSREALGGSGDWRQCGIGLCVGVTTPTVAVDLYFWFKELLGLFAV